MEVGNRPELGVGQLIDRALGSLERPPFLVGLRVSPSAVLFLGLDERIVDQGPEVAARILDLLAVVLSSYPTGKGGCHQRVDGLLPCSASVDPEALAQKAGDPVRIRAVGQRFAQALFIINAQGAAFFLPPPVLSVERRSALIPER